MAFDKRRMRLLFTFRVSATSPSPFSAHLFSRRPIGRAGSSIMIGLVRAAIFCATLSFGLISAALPSAQAADKAFKRNDYRTGLQILGQIATAAPDDSGNWVRLARAIFLMRSANSSEQTFLLERASTAA